MKERNKSVLFVLSDLGPGGAQRVLSIIAERLLADSYEVSVVTHSEPAADFYGLPSEIRRYSTHGLAASPNLYQAVVANLRRLRALRRIIKEVKPAVLFSFLGETNILTIIASAGLPVRVVVSERSDPARARLSWPWPLLRRLTYRLADRVTANSKGTVAYLETFVNPEKLTLLQNPIVNFKQTNEKAKEGSILAVGRLTGEKGIDVLLEAMARLKSRSREYALCIVGDGPERAALETLAIEMGVADQVTWHGFQTEVRQFYQSATVFVMPSRREGMPNAMLEAMTEGVPVIVSNASPGPLEYVRDGETGLVVDSGSSRQLADAIEKIMVDGQLRASLGKAARKAVEPCWVDNVIGDWEEVLQS